MIVLAAFPLRYVFPIAALSYHRLTILYSELVEFGTWKAIFRLGLQGVLDTNLHSLHPP